MFTHCFSNPGKGKELLMGGNNFVVNSMNQPKKVDGAVDLDQEIDVVNWSGGARFQPVKAEEDPDATEYSSSFGDTLSGSDCDSKMDFGDMEVESQLAPMSREHGGEIDDFNNSFRKKKVTAHWRKFISPIAWRCHWLELRTKELLLQASKYDNELAAYKCEKESQLVNLVNSVSKLTPLESLNHRKELMRRRKRKRLEDKVDVSSYMSNHAVFSYYENKRTETDGHSVDNDCNDINDHLKVNEDCEWLLGSDSAVEQILLNIDSIQSRIAKLKSHLNKVVCRRAKESSFLGNIVPGDPLSSFAQNVSDFMGNNGESGTIGVPSTAWLRLSEDIVKHESAVSNSEGAVDPDILCSTSGLLSAVDNGHQIGALSKFAEEDILIDNQVAEDEFQNYEKVHHAIEMPPEVVKKELDMHLHSCNESSAPKEIKLEPQAESERPLEALLKACHSGKRRGRKPKKMRLGVATSTPGMAVKSEKLEITGSDSSLSEKMKLTGSSSSSSLRTRMKKMSAASTTSWTERLKVGSNVSCWKSERIRKQRQLGKSK